MLEVKLEYFEFVNCSICSKDDEGIDINIFDEDKDFRIHMSCNLSICESCWAKWFKKFKKDK